MDDMKICMGIWGQTNLPDRFNVKGFGDDVSVIDRIKECGEIEGISGIELHVPTEINTANEKEIGKVLDGYGLKMVQLCGHTWTEKRFKNGALADADLKIRQQAVDRVKEALDMGARFDVPISVLWPATDGNDFPLQQSYLDLYERYVESVRKILEHLHKNGYATKICIEPKPFEPRSHILMGNTAQALTIVNEVDDPNFGINLDIGHSLIAHENLEDQLGLVLRYGRLYHTHFNDNDQQADMDVPPGVVNFIRLVSFMFVLEEAEYDGWYGLDLFPYRDSPRSYIELSVENLHRAKRVAELLMKNGARELQKSGDKGIEMSRLMLKCIREAG